jgi:dTDP-4-amino-4,6-dideoxygalactose transaminase
MAYAPIHLSPPDMSARERQALLEAFDSNWIAPAGPALNEFEARVQSVSGTDAAVAVTSGTAALHLALRVLGIGPGDIVLVPTVTFVASANAVRYVGAVPHFVDCDPRTGNIDPDQLERAIRNLDAVGYRPAAVMTVDLYGACANYREIERTCRQFDIPIIEDAAEAIGATHLGRPAGSFGTLAAFSFNGNKLVTTGGGGALVGRADLIEHARYLSSQARDSAIHFEHSDLGYAYRLSNISAAIGCAQLERLDRLVARTRAIHRRYVDELSHIEGLEVISQDRDGRGNGWLTVVQIDRDRFATPSSICGRLADERIEARPSWKPMHQQPLYLGSPITGGHAANAHFDQGLCLPSGSALTEGEQTRVVEAFTHALGVQPTIELTALDLRVAQPLRRRDSPVPTS